MITRLTLTNFMAHAATVLDFPPGLSVLTGPNNIGKSAVVEALRCLTQNPVPHHVIRHGAAEARVTVTLSDGTEVAWVRRPAYALYELTRPGATAPEVFAKFNRTPPEEILDVLRLDLVTLENGKTVDVHLGDQREPIFLLNQSGPVVAGFFAASSEAAHLIAMQNRLTDRVRKTKGEAKRLEVRLAAIAASLDKLAPLPELEYRLSRTDDLEAGLAVLDRDIPALERSLADRRTVLDRLARLKRTDAILSRLDAPRALDPTGPLTRCLENCRILTAARERVAGRRSILAELTPPPVLADAAALAARTGELVRTIRAGRRQAARAALLARLQPLPVLADTAGLATLLGRLEAARQGCGSLGVTTGRLAALTPPPEVAETRRLAESAAAIAAARENLAAKRAEVTERTGALAASEARIAARLHALGVCPLCGAALSAADFLGGGHTHSATDRPS